MAGITLEQAQTKLDQYLAAETAALEGQSYTIAGRTLTRANLDEIRRGIDAWDRRCKELAATAGGRGRARVIAPRW